MLLSTSKINSSLRFVIYDSEGSSVKTLELVKEIGYRSDIHGIVGPMLKEEVLVISGFISSIPILIPNTGPSDFSDITTNLFFLSPSEKIIAERTAQLMIRFFRFKNIAVLSPADNESKIKTDYFLNECNQLGIKPIAVEWYSEKPENLSKQFKSIRNAAWNLIPGESDKNDLDMNIDSLDALFDVPENITSSIPEPLILLADVSPITHLRDSTILDFPHPFGPTIPVKPFSIKKLVLSAKDLNPLS